MGDAQEDSVVQDTDTKTQKNGGGNCHGGDAATQSGGDAHRRQCGSGRKGKRGRRSRGRSTKPKAEVNRGRGKKEDVDQKKWWLEKHTQ